jgi:phage terminase large subunit-like protein
MAWSVGNAWVEPGGNAIVITKQASGPAKIDQVMAAFNAIALVCLNPDEMTEPRILFCVKNVLQRLLHSV